MPRFHVVIADPNDTTIRGYIARIHSPVDAICNHPWVTEVYNNRWIAKHVWADDLDTVIQNFYNILGWIVLCVNLDDEIMNALNDGDSSASLPMPQN